MEGFQKDYLISRIVCGYLRYPINKKVIRIYHPNKHVLYESNEIYIDVYKKALQNGIMDDKNIYHMMLDYEIWTEEKEKELNYILPKHIEYWKIKLYEAAFKSKEREQIRKYLDIAKKELLNLHSQRHAFDHVSCNGIANYAKFQYIIEKSSYDSNNKLYNWTKSSPYLAMCYYQDNIILEEEIREISHTTPWENIWSASKKGGRLFDKEGIEYSIDQQRLIIWSSMYDSIKEANDCPPDDIINDDDMLDGWLLIKKQEREAAGLGSQAEGMIKNSKINQAYEVYMVANTVEDAKKIDMLNSQFARNIKKQRFDFIEKRGQVNEVYLPDIQQKLSMQITQAMSAQVKGR